MTGQIMVSINAFLKIGIGHLLIISTLSSCNSTLSADPNDTDSVVSLAEYYFTNPGADPRDTVLERIITLQEDVEKAEEALSRVNGEYMDLEEILEGLVFLESNDGEADNYKGLLKGRVQRLREDIIPFWGSESMKSRSDSLWTSFALREWDLQTKWLDHAKSQKQFLMDQKLPHDALARYGIWAVFETPGEIEHRKKGLLNNRIALLQVEIDLLDESLLIFVNTR